MGTSCRRPNRPRPLSNPFDRTLIGATILRARCPTVAVAVGVVMALGVPSLGADYYVSTTGDDVNSGTLAAPFRTIQRGVDGAGPGDRVLIRAGTYRESVVVNVSGTESNYVEILGYPNETPVVKGSDIVTDWTYHANFIWKVEEWTTGCQQVFVDGMLLQRIGYPNSFFAANTDRYAAVGSDSSNMIPGSFFCDTNQNVLYVWLPDSSNPAGHTVEASVRNSILKVKSGHRYVYINGITFQHNNSLSFSNFSGAGVRLGESCEIVNCRIELCDFAGVSLQSSSRIIECDVSRNGNLGINWNGSSNIVVSGCTIMSNNVSHFYHRWHAGGMKVIPNGSGIVEDNEVAWNYGNGIWFDQCRSDQLITIRRNYVHDNMPVPWEAASGAKGISVEISKNVFVHDNLVTGNNGGGIAITGSESVRVINNTISGNMGFAALRGVTTPRLISTNPDVWAAFANNSVLNNLIVDNDCTFDFAFPSDNSSPTNLIYGNTSDYNCVFNSTSGPSFKLVGTVQSYSTLDAWAAATGWDSNSLEANPILVSGGFELHPNSPCANRGKNEPWMSGAYDLAGGNRIVDGIVDIGCYEMTVPNLPVITITNKVSSVPPGVSSFVLKGTNNLNVAGPMTIRNVTRDLEQSFARFGTQWQAPAMGLWDGMTTRLEVYGSNAAGVVRHDWVEITTPNLSTHYVSPSGSHQFPFASWATAATSIQAAADAAMPGDTVLVADGLYQTGQRLAQGRDTRLVIDKAITVRSLNGPGAATIRGAAGSVRCAYVGAGARLEGFTLSDGYGGAYVDGGSISNCVVTGCSDPGGWGAGINSRFATVSDCVVEYANGFHGAIRSLGGLVERCELRYNTMTGHGGGIFADQGAVVRNSLIYSNYSNYGGALTLFDSEADGCTVENNTKVARVSGILLRGSTASNCISWSDDSGLDAGYTGSFVHCSLAVAPDPAADGGGNLVVDPLFESGSYTLRSSYPVSPCADQGLNAPWMSGAYDLAGGNRVENGTVDMGCYEIFVSGPPAVTITNKVQSVALGVSSYVLKGTNNLNVAGPLVLSNATRGLVQSFVRFGTQWQAPAMGLWDGMTTRLEVYGSNAAGVVRHDWVEITTPNLSTHFVSPSGSHQFPFATWATAATSIQAAVDMAMPGDTVLVDMGLYQTGQRLAQGRDTRLVIDKAITVRSLDGPGAATIRGAAGSVRCAYVGAGARLEGFTLSDGYGGAYVDGGSISNCVVTGCSDPGGWGAGIFSRFGAVSDCVVEYANGFHGAIRSLGGLVERCELRYNTMTGHGGGIFADQGAVVRNSLIYGNHSNYGGALTLFDSEADACTVENNTKIARVSGILLRGSTASNCISWSDDSGLDAGYTGSFVHCCLAVAPVPAADGGGNTTLDPNFAANGSDPFRLKPESPCIDTGLDYGQPLFQDLIGTPRPLDGDMDGTSTLDMGAYEFDPYTADSDSDSDLMPDLWETQYGLNPTNALDALEDADNDGADNRSEYIAGTNPLDPASFFAVSGASTTSAGSEFTITWSSTSGRQYTLYRGSSLLEGLTEIVTGIPATPPLNVYIDSTPPSSYTWFYRVGVELDP